MSKKPAITDEQYLLYTHSNRPIFAVSAWPRRVRRAALKRLQPSTRKRAIYRAVVASSMLAGMDWIFGLPARPPFEGLPGSDFDWDCWLRKMQGYFEVEQLAAAIFWPSPPNRGRLYIHLFNGGRPIGYAKVSLHADNRERFAREADALRMLGGLNPESFRVPRLMMKDEAGGKEFLLVEPMPSSAQPVGRALNAYPAECVDEYSGTIRQAAADEISTLSWWTRYVQRLDAKCRPFHDELTALLGPGIRVCRAHGDLSWENVVRAGRTTWIFDWEESVPDAPAQTDVVGFAMSLNETEVRDDPLPWTGAFKSRYLANAGSRHRAEVMMALAFRFAAGFEDAEAIIRNWNRC